MPQAFQQFRAALAEIVVEAIKEGGGDSVALQLRLDQHISKHLGVLESELQSEARRSRLVGYGVPVVAGGAALLGGALGVGLMPLLGINAAAAGAAVSAAGDFARARGRVEGNPVYFLWSAIK